MASSIGAFSLRLCSNFVKDPGNNTSLPSTSHTLLFRFHRHCLDNYSRDIWSKSFTKSTIELVSVRCPVWDPSQGHSHSRCSGTMLLVLLVWLQLLSLHHYLVIDFFVLNFDCLNPRYPCVQELYIETRYTVFSVVRRILVNMVWS